jgi:FdhD protein
MTPDSPDLPEPSRLTRLGYSGPLLEVEARQWLGDQVASRTERVIEEIPVVLVYNQVPHVVMMATPADLEDFALGFSVTEELVRSPADVLGVEIVAYSRGIEVQIRVPAECQAVIETRSRRLTGRTGCGICGSDSIDAVLKSARRVEPTAAVAPEAIRRAVRSIGVSQRLNEASGAVHAAAWVGLDGSIEVVREDVGRHNALDKLVGACLRVAADPRRGFVVVTSRASFEMVQKATVLGASLVVAMSGPTALAVRLADEAGVCLVGFAREGRFTAYTHPERIVS